MEYKTEAQWKPDNVLEFKFWDSLQKRGMLPSDQHVTIYGDQNVRDVGAHFDCLAQIGHKYDFEQLDGHIGIDGRAIRGSTQWFTG